MLVSFASNVWTVVSPSQPFVELFIVNNLYAGGTVEYRVAYQIIQQTGEQIVVLHGRRLIPMEEHDYLQFKVRHNDADSQAIWGATVSDVALSYNEISKLNAD
jgi:hypothetical protein